jgi:hypothetical protein
MSWSRDACGCADLSSIIQELDSVVLILVEAPLLDSVLLALLV